VLTSDLIVANSTALRYLLLDFCASGDVAMIDTALLSTIAALTGSLIGGVATLTASWLTQRLQLRIQATVHEAAKRENLYAEFIIEASRRLADAWSHHAESPEVIAGLYSAVQRMRLASSDKVIHLADQVIREVVDAYAAPDRTFDELGESIRGDEPPDALKDFGEACRIELRTLRT
jgi:hypothetical protein